MKTPLKSKESSDEIEEENSDESKEDHIPKARKSKGRKAQKSTPPLLQKLKIMKNLFKGLFKRYSKQLPKNTKTKIFAYMKHPKMRDFQRCI